MPESKSTIQVIGKNAFNGAGTGGVRALSLQTGAVTGNVHPPVVAGLDPSVVVANSVAANVDLLFICNGEARVYVARSKEEFNKARSGELLDLILLG